MAAPKKKATKSAKPRLTPDAIMQLGLGFWGSKTLLSAIELGLFTELAKGPVEAKALRQRLGLHERSARDFFDALVSLGMLRRKGTTYSNTPEIGSLSRPRQAFLHRRDPRDGGGSALRFLGLAD